MSLWHFLPTTLLFIHYALFLQFPNVYSWNFKYFLFFLQSVFSIHWWCGEWSQNVCVIVRVRGPVDIYLSVFVIRANILPFAFAESTWVWSYHYRIACDHGHPTEGVFVFSLMSVFYMSHWQVTLTSMEWQSNCWGNWAVWGLVRVKGDGLSWNIFPGENGFLGHLLACLPTWLAGFLPAYLPGWLASCLPTYLALRHSNWQVSLCAKPPIFPAYGLSVLLCLSISAPSSDLTSAHS